MNYFLELYGSLPRAGPGDPASTQRAFGMMAHRPPAPSILDLGCGPGVQTVELLRLSPGRVVALDNLPHMLERCREAAVAAGVAERLDTVQGDMHDLTFEAGSFDVVWSEGAIYIMGFENGLSKVKKLVKPGGYVCVSEVVWLKPDPPDELASFWQEYPEIGPVDAKLEIMARLGYDIVGHFILPDSSWTESYYEPLAARMALYADAWNRIPEARNVLAEAQRELDMFARYSAYYGYAFFIMRRPIERTASKTTPGLFLPP